MSKVTLTVSGSRFEINSKCLEEQPFQRLPLMVEEAKKNGQPLEFVIDRPVERFSAIIAYYQTGELHIPGGVCPGAFQQELLYWDLDSDKLSDCCMTRYISFLEEQESIKKFRQEVLRSQSNIASANVWLVPVKSCKTLATFRCRLWNIIDNNESSCIAKIYFLLLFLMVILSILSLALSTDQAFKRKLSKCEMLEYLEYTKKEDWKRLEKQLGSPECEDSNFEEYDWDHFKDSYNDGSTEDETPNTGESGAAAPTVPGGGIPATTTKQKTTSEEYESSDKKSMRSSGPPSHNRIDIPNVTIPVRAFDIIDIVLLTFFTLDILLRLSTCPSIPKYFLSVINVVDMVALAGTYVHVIILAIKKDQRYVDNWVDVIQYFQVFRTLRLFRVVKNVRATKVLIYALKQSFRDLLILLMFLMIAVCTFASFVYFAEERDSVESIPAGWWWALVTLTTVGYGDIAPRTGAGRLVGSVCAVTGVILISLTLPIFVNNFLTLYQYAVVDDVLQAKLKDSRKDRVEPLPELKHGSLSQHANTGNVIDKAKSSESTLTIAAI